MLVDVEERRQQGKFRVTDDPSSWGDELIETVTLLGAGNDPAVSHC